MGAVTDATVLAVRKELRDIVMESHRPGFLKNHGFAMQLVNWRWTSIGVTSIGMFSGMKFNPEKSISSPHYYHEIEVRAYRPGDIESGHGVACVMEFAPALTNSSLDALIDAVRRKTGDAFKDAREDYHLRAAARAKDQTIQPRTLVRTPNVYHEDITRLTWDTKQLEKNMTDGAEQLRNLDPGRRYIDRTVGIARLRAATVRQVIVEVPPDKLGPEPKRKQLGEKLIHIQQKFGKAYLGCTMRTQDGRFQTFYEGVPLIYGNQSKDRWVIQNGLGTFISRIEEFMGARNLPPGRYAALLHQQPFGLLIHEAIEGHGTDAQAVGDGEIATATLYGSQLFRIPIHITVDGSRGRFGSSTYDSEGTLCREVRIVDEGKLIAHLNTREGAALLRERPHGNARVGFSEDEDILEYLEPEEEETGIGFIPQARTSYARVGLSPDKYAQLAYLRNKLERIARQRGDPGWVEVVSLQSGVTWPEEGKMMAYHPLVYFHDIANGKRIPMRGVNISENPAAFMQSIIGMDDKHETSYGYCSDTSGVVTSTSVAPHASSEGISFIRVLGPAQKKPPFSAPSTRGAY